MRRVASALVALSLTAASLPALEARAAEAASTPAVVDPAVKRQGVAVLAIGDDAADETWPVALAVYGDAGLRPRLADRDARALAGAEPAKDAAKETKELAELRAQVRGDDAASRLLLKEIARRTSTVALVLVFPKREGAPTQARLYDAADDAVDATLHRAGTSGWSALVSTLHGRYAKPDATSPSATTTSGAGKDATGAAGANGKGGGVLSSPWFWGAIGVAVIGAAVLVATSHGSDSQSPSGLRIEWGK